MYKKILLASLLLVLITVSAFAAAPKIIPISIDDLEDGNVITSPNWWSFDAIKLKVVSAREYEISDLGKYVLDVSGKAKGWYVGGFGMYLAQPVDKYTHIQIDVCGTGENSGKLKIELSEDDNGNKKIEQDISKNYAPTKDDKFSYELPIDWKGWKQLLIPLKEFEDINPGVGNDTWDPDNRNGSGGLIQFQFIVIGTKETADTNFKLDNIKIVKYEGSEE
ncbi:MAG: glycan-binding surface protein [Candidatus Margulisiibacteriota bacterium]|jgi:hypothetical protein